MTAHHQIRLQLAVLLLALGGCGKSSPPQAARTVDLDPPPVASAPTALPAGATKAVAPPAAPPQAVTPAAAQPPKRSPSVALHLSSGKSAAFALPEVGRQAKVTVTAVDADGRPYTELGQALDAKLVMVAMRTDGSWARVMRATELSLPDRGKHDFRLVFPLPGALVMLFAYQPLTGPLVSVPSYIDVRGGKRPVSITLGERELVHKGRASLEVVLNAPEAPLQVCTPVVLSSTWKRKGKPLPERVAGGPVHYVAMHMGLTAVALARPWQPPAGATEVVASGDPGTQVALRLPRSGRYRVIAIAQEGKQEHTALFTLTAVGDAPPTGCPPEG